MEKVFEKRVRKNKMTRMFSLQENLPAHYRLCIFNILLVLFLFTIVVMVELILDSETIRGPNFFSVLSWLIPVSVQGVAILLFTGFGCLYFATAKFFPQNKSCFKFGTVLIGAALTFFLSTIIWSPWYIVAYFCNIDNLGIMVTLLPALFYMMLTLLILSIFNCGFIFWVAGWMVVQKILEASGLKTRQQDLVKPIKLVNEDKRTIEISVKNDDEILIEHDLVV